MQSFVCNRLCEEMFQTCFECGCRGEVLQSHPLPISPLLQTPDPRKRGRKRYGYIRLRRQRNTTDSSAEVFLVRKGPFAWLLCWSLPVFQALFDPRMPGKVCVGHVFVLFFPRKIRHINFLGGAQHGGFWVRAQNCNNKQK